MFIHGFFVLAAYWKLYGFTFDPRIVLACFIHDLGYIGKIKMDDEVGETHPLLGASIMGLFDRDGSTTWYDFALLHSRYYAKRLGRNPSRLCIADKLAIALTPWWLYLPMVKATGEIKQYMEMATSKNGGEHTTSIERQGLKSGNAKKWFLGLQSYMRRWVESHKENLVDTWTNGSPQLITRQLNND